jgi:flagellar biogenesis protein FliO
MNMFYDDFIQFFDLSLLSSLISSLIFVLLLVLFLLLLLYRFITLFYLNNIKLKQFKSTKQKTKIINDDIEI